MRRLLLTISLGVVLACGLVPAPAARAQEPSTGPRFLLAPSSSASTRALVPVDASRVPALGRRIALDLGGVTLKEALVAIAERSGLDLFYSDDVVPLDRRVHLQAQTITVAAALTDVLFGVGVDVVLNRGRGASLVKRVEPAPARTGTVTGRVTDGKTGEGLVGAEVSLDDTRLRTTTGEDGRYRLGNVAAGSYTLSVRRIGYRRETRAVTVADGEEVTVDVVLEAVPTQLDEVVTTVTGEQRIRELGHVVGRINADSLVREAPVASVTELLNARVPGMQVFTGQGTVGGDASIRIRGATTMRLSQEPIVIVDGVRYTSDRKGVGFSLGAGSTLQEPTSRLNDLNPNDIESIEVVKGPSAATLYGTDAVNGVIVITTKRGRPGPARWNAYTRAAMSEIPVQRFPDGVWGWSSSAGNCTLSRVAQGTCTQDSVTTVPNPLNDPALTIFGSKPRWEYGANVSGGGSGIRYFISGDFEDATGPVRMPAALVEELEESRGVTELPEEQLEPNGFTKANLRSNVTVSLGDKADLQVSAGYTRNATRSMSVYYSPYSNGAFSGTPNDPYGTSSAPDQAFSLGSTEKVSRFTGSMRFDARPRPWLATWASFGLDLGNTTRHTLARPGEGPRGFTSGMAEEDRRRDLLTTADLGTRATFQFGRLSSRTAVGAQYVRTFYDGMTVRGSTLPPGGETVASAESKFVTSGYSETVTLGGYLEQTIGLNERLFLTGALRADGASTFGRDYSAVIYPKASVSWIVSEEPFLPRPSWLDELRLRYAYGASGRQPTTAMALPGYRRSSTFADGREQNTLNYYALGNPDLRPERTREHEFGFDASLLEGRVRLEGTWYYRRTVDGIQSMALAPGFGSVSVNVGLVRDQGFEAQLWTRVIDSRALSWDLSLQHSSNTNRLVNAGDVLPIYAVNGGLVEGYPIGARFMLPFRGYEDANGDGIIERSEVVMGDTAVYVGSSVPPQTQTLSTVLGLFEQRLRFSALFERRAGYTEEDFLGYTRCRNGYCRAAVDPASPLDAQARIAALGLYPPGKNATRYTFLDVGTFVRLREVTMSCDLPQTLVRAARLQHAALSLSARNLAVWTSFQGVDVESVVGGGWRPNGNAGTPYGIPQARSWVLRLDIGF